MRRTWFVATLAALAGVLAVAMLVSCTGGDGTGGGGSEEPSTETTDGAKTGGTVVVEKDIAFDPPTVTVKAGEKVTFKNEDSVAHQVEIDGEELELQSPGDDVTWTASETGTYPFTCTIHPSMTGEVTVE